MKTPKPPVAAVLLFAMLTLSAPAPSLACLVVPSLWDVIESADLIVVARVVRVEREAADDDLRLHVNYRYTTVAVLEVTEAWKGSPPDELRVSFQWGAPTDWVPDAVVLAFLQSGESMVEERRAALESRNAPPAADATTESERPLEESDAVDVIVLDETGGGEDSEDVVWTAEDEARAREEEERIRAREDEEIRAWEAWAAGRWLTLDPPYEVGERWDENQKGLAELVARAAELQDGGRASESDRRAWLVAAVENPATRGEALRDLLAQKSRLSGDELAALTASFSRSPAVDDSDLVMLRIFAGRADLEVDRAAAAVVEAGIRLTPVPAWVVSFVEETLRRCGDDFAARIGRDDRDARGRPIYTGPGENTLWTIWEVARRDLGIPQAPAPVPERRPSRYQGLVMD